MNLRIGDSHRSCRTRCRRDAATHHRHKSNTRRVKCALPASSLSHQSRQACRQRADSVLRQRVSMLRTMRSCCCFCTAALRAKYISAAVRQHENRSTSGHLKLDTIRMNKMQRVFTVDPERFSSVRPTPCVAPLPFAPLPLAIETGNLRVARPAAQLHCPEYVRAANVQRQLARTAKLMRRSGASFGATVRLTLAFVCTFPSSYTPPPVCERESKMVAVSVSVV